MTYLPGSDSSDEERPKKSQKVATGKSAVAPAVQQRRIRKEALQQKPAAEPVEVPTAEVLQKLKQLEDNLKGLKPEEKSSKYVCISCCFALIF